MGKIITTKYFITDPSISNNQKIAYLSDLHSDINRLEEIIKILNDLDIKILLIGGDLLDSTKDYKQKAEIKRIFKELSKTITIYIGFGNHELLHYKINEDGSVDELKSQDVKYWEDINTIKNVNVSILPVKESSFTKWSLNENIDIYALNFPVEHYINHESKEDFEKQLKVLENININPNKYNILLCHTPKNLIENDIICKDYEFLKKYNLILTGHMHNGLVPEILKNKNYGRGLVGPYITFAPKYSYGLINNENRSLIISGGVTKLSKSQRINKILRSSFAQSFLDKFYFPEIEIIDLNHGENNSIKKLKKVLD